MESANLFHVKQMFDPSVALIFVRFFKLKIGILRIDVF